MFKPILGLSKCEEQCKWFFRNKPGFRCRAFPEGIAKKIIDGEIEHNRILAGQKGTYIFEPREEEK